MPRNQKPNKGGDMKKLLVVTIGVAFVLGLAAMSYATDTVVTDSKVKVTEKAGKTVIKEKEKVVSDTGKEVSKTKITATDNEVIVKEKDKIKTGKETDKVKERITATEKGTLTEEKVMKTYHDKSPLKKEKVTFVSYSDADGGTITVIKDKKEVKMPATLHTNWKHNVLEKKNKEVTITSSYDPKLNQYIVNHVE